MAFLRVNHNRPLSKTTQGSHTPAIADIHKFNLLQITTFKFVKVSVAFKGLQKWCDVYQSYKPFKKQSIRHLTSGCVHPDEWGIDQPTSLSDALYQLVNWSNHNIWMSFYIYSSIELKCAWMMAGFSSLTWTQSRLIGLWGWGCSQVALWDINGQ